MIAYHKNVQKVSRRILFPVLSGAYFSSAWKLAGLIKKRGPYSPVFLFWADMYTPSAEQLAVLKSNGFITETISATFRGLSSWVLAVVSNRVFIVQVVVDLFQTFVLRRSIRRLVRRHRISLFLLPADNRYAYPHITSLAELLKVQVLVFPSWFASELEIISVFSESPRHTKGLEKGLLRNLWKSHLRYVNKGGTEPRPMIPFSKSEIFVRKFFSSEVPNPWILNSTRAKKILVETRAAFEYARRLGFEDDQLTLTGSVFLDEMTQVRRRFSPQESSPSTAVYRVAVALPPDMFDYPVADDCEFRNHEDLVEAWCYAIKKIPNSRLVMALHPSTPRKIAEKIQRMGIEVSDEETHLLIAQSDIYIASISATIQWALAAGIPTVNYDVYGFNYLDYENNPLVLPVNSYDEFLGLLKRDPEDLILQTRRQVQKLGKHLQTELDGNSGDRILAAINSVVDDGS